MGKYFIKGFHFVEFIIALSFLIFRLLFGAMSGRLVKSVLESSKITFYCYFPLLFALLCILVIWHIAHLFSRVEQHSLRTFPFF